MKDLAKFQKEKCIQTH